jgi:hypothetical protein
LRRKKKEKKKIYQRQTGPPTPTHATPIRRGYNGDSNNMTEGYFWMPYTSPSFYFNFLFSQTRNFPWADYVITKKKNPLWKAELTSSLNFSSFSVFSSFYSAFLLFVYYFYIWSNTKLSFTLNYNNKKIIVNIWKYPSTSSLFLFLFLRVF